MIGAVRKRNIAVTLGSMAPAGNRNSPRIGQAGCGPIGGIGRRFETGDLCFHPWCHAIASVSNIRGLNEVKRQLGSLTLP